MESLTKKLFTQAFDLLILCSTRAALKVPFLGQTPKLPFDDATDLGLPEGSDLHAYKDERELRDGLTARLRKALKGHGLFATERLAVALGKLWTTLTELGEGATFVYWLDTEFGILLPLTELELSQISRLRNQPREKQPSPTSASSEVARLAPASRQAQIVQKPAYSAKVPGQSGTVTQHPAMGIPPSKGKE